MFAPANKATSPKNPSRPALGGRDLKVSDCFGGNTPRNRWRSRPAVVCCAAKNISRISATNRKLKTKGISCRINHFQFAFRGSVTPDPQSKKTAPSIPGTVL